MSRYYISASNLSRFRQFYLLRSNRGFKTTGRIWEDEANKVHATFAGIPRRKIIPLAPPPSSEQIDKLYDFITNSKRLVVLTGAGVSTASGIPDYRGPEGAYSSGFKPMTHQDFLRSEANRARYWRRSYIGWLRFVQSKPSEAHLALSRLEERGRLEGGIITQNVDRLHSASGSKNILELHGTTHETVCLECGEISPRNKLQERIKELNPKWALAVQPLERGTSGTDLSFGMRQRPDGDVEVDENFWQQEVFLLPECQNCGGILKPNVVFFGDNLPRDRAQKALQMVTAGDSLLVVGSSLMVLSAFRLARGAQENKNKLAILNVGPTRADDLADLKIEAVCGEVDLPPLFPI